MASPSRIRTPGSWCFASRASSKSCRRGSCSSQVTSCSLARPKALASRASRPSSCGGATSWRPRSSRLAFCAIQWRPTETDMQLTSNSFKDGDYLGMDHVLSAEYGFGCSGGNRSPHLAWSGAPEDTQSFALTCYDPDAPTGSGFWHWVVVNIPADVTELALDAGNPKSGKLPAGALQVRTDFGAPAPGPPAPPQGDHPPRYLFTIFAVGTPSLQVTADTSAAVVGFQLHFN